MEQGSIPEKWIGEMVAVVDKQDQDAINGRLLEVNDRGIALRVVYEFEAKEGEAEEGEPARLSFSTNFYPWATVRFMWKPDEAETQVLEESSDNTS